MDGGRQTAAGRASQPVEEQTVNEWGTNKRIQTADRGMDDGQWTADRRRTGFPACR